MGPKLQLRTSIYGTGFDASSRRSAAARSCTVTTAGVAATGGGTVGGPTLTTLGGSDGMGAVTDGGRSGAGTGAGAGIGLVRRRDFTVLVRPSICSSSLSR